jgi:hypothetical protein
MCKGRGTVNATAVRSKAFKTNGNGANLSFEAQLFLAADQLRRTVRLQACRAWSDISQAHLERLRGKAGGAAGGRPRRRPKRKVRNRGGRTLTRAVRALCVSPEPDSTDDVGLVSFVQVEHGLFRCCIYSWLQHLLRVGANTRMTEHPNVNCSRC